jgi:hypothetical protein
VLDGMNRTDAARIGGMDRQTLCDWVHRFNRQGPDGLKDTWSRGNPPRLSPAQPAALAGIVETGPDRSVDGVVRWRRVDLRRRHRRRLPSVAKLHRTAQNHPFNRNERLGTRRSEIEAVGIIFNLSRNSAEDHLPRTAGAISAPIVVKAPPKRHGPRKAAVDKVDIQNTLPSASPPAKLTPVEVEGLRQHGIETLACLQKRRAERRPLWPP